MRSVLLFLGTALILCSASPAQQTASQLDPATKQMARDIFQQLIEINTTDSVGNTTTAAQAMAKRLTDAGFPAADVQVLGPNDRKGNLVARYRGTGAKKPFLIIAHLDVVEALRSDWTTDPFKFVEKDGFYYGRGTQDMKEDDALMITNFIRLWKEGYKPDRDIILALTSDEEGGKSNGVSWLVDNHRDLIDAEFVLNPDAGGVDLDHGKPLIVAVEATEKVYSDFQLTATNPGGHSSLPRPDNAIYEITNALNNLEHFTFPFELNGVTRVYFEKMADRKTGQVAADMRAILKPNPDPAANQAPFRRSFLQLERSHYLRRHPAQCWSRQQRAAAERAGDCELPHLSRPRAGRDSSAADQDICECQNHGQIRGQWGRYFRRCARPQTHRAAAADP